MEDYPRTLREFEFKFASEAACVEFLRQLRWPEGFVCPNCQNRGGWVTKSGQMICTKCRNRTTVTAGIFQDSHQPLTV